jgi:hypothetical protein
MILVYYMMGLKNYFNMSIKCLVLSGNNVSNENKKLSLELARSRNLKIEL